MRRIMLTTAFGALLVGATGAMAQPYPYPYPAPVPNASGSQTTNPGSYGDTTGMMVAPGEPMAAGTCPPPPNASGSLVTAPCSYYNMGTAPGMDVSTTGSIIMQPAPMYGPGPMYAPVPNASGSQTTNPMSYGNTRPR
jgi:hypothetical protein